MVDLLIVVIKFIISLLKEAERAVNPLIFEYLSSFLGLLLTFDRISYKKCEGEESFDCILKSNLLYDYFIDKLLAFKWKPDNLIQLTVMFRDLHGLSVHKTQEIIEKIIAVLPSVSPEETPALFYQLLLFGRGSTQTSNESAQITVAVFNGLIGYFSTLEDLAYSVDRMTAMDQAFIESNEGKKLESQCATHIVLALKHNQWLALEFMKHVKKLAKRHLPRFALMILLSMTETYQFASVVPGLIKANILQHLANCDIYTKKGPIQGLKAVSFDHLEKSYAKLVKGLSFESETAIKSLLTLSLDMLNWNTSPSVKTYLNQLALSTLKDLFFLHDYAREEVISRIIDRLCICDSLHLANVVVEFYDTQAEFIQDMLVKRLDLLVVGESFSKLTALVMPNVNVRYKIRTLLLSE